MTSGTVGRYNQTLFVCGLSVTDLVKSFEKSFLNEGHRIHGNFILTTMVTVIKAFSHLVLFIRRAFYFLINRARCAHALSQLNHTG